MIEYYGCQYCKHFRIDGSCPAFYPNPIPLSIVSGKVKHIKPIFGQRNDIVYEFAGKSIIYRLDEIRIKEREIFERIEVIKGDITQQKVDAIVNAANEALIAGGGVSGAIHKAAGPKLEEECLQIGECPEGEVKITKGYNLLAKWVIHTVGPVWEGGNYGEEEVLRKCYRNSLSLAEEHNLKSIAFPAISTGAYEFPQDKATKIAITEAKYFLEKNTSIEKVIFVCFDLNTYDAYILNLKEAFSILFRKEFTSS